MGTSGSRQSLVCASPGMPYHLHLLDMGDEFGTMAMTGMGITIYRTVGLVDTGYMSQDIGGSPRRAAFVGIWVVARERHVGTYLIERLLVATNNS